MNLASKRGAAEILGAPGGAAALADPAAPRESSGSVEAFGAAGAVFMNGNPRYPMVPVLVGAICEILGKSGVKMRIYPANPLSARSCERLRRAEQSLLPLPIEIGKRRLALRRIEQPPVDLVAGGTAQLGIVDESQAVLAGQVAALQGACASAAHEVDDRPDDARIIGEVAVRLLGEIGLEAGQQRQGHGNRALAIAVRAVLESGRGAPHAHDRLAIHADDLDHALVGRGHLRARAPDACEQARIGPRPLARPGARIREIALRRRLSGPQG